MNSYHLFKLCMGCKGRSYNKSEEDYNESPYFNFFNMLIKYFTKELKFNDLQIKQYVSVCAKLYEGSFDPWKLNSREYLEAFKAWYKINSSANTYLASVRDSIKNIVKFCKQKKINSLENYITNWGVTHYISGVLNDNVAYALKLQEVTLSKPEKFMIRKFLKNVPMIKERLEREGKLKTLLESEIKQAKEMLFWISGAV